MIRESSRINALENMVLKMASDLTSSKDKLKEVKELLLRLVNPRNTISPHHMDTSPTPPSIQPPSSVLPSREAIAHSGLHEPPREFPSKCSQPQNFADGGDARTPEPPILPSPPSWASGDTVPVTPSTLLQNFKNKMPIGAAVSTDVSVSTATTSNGLSPQSGRSDCLTRNEDGLGAVGEFSGGRSQINSIAEDRVTTRGMMTETETATAPCGPRPRFEVGLLPRLLDNAIAANAQCFILHPDYGDLIVAEGRTGGSWKSPKQKFG